MLEAEDIRKVMGLQAQKVCKKVFRSRPNAVTSKLTQFIVVSLPFSASNKTVGEDDDWWLDETVVYEIYVADDRSADATGQPDDKTMKMLRSSIKALFPITDPQGRFKITRPRTVINSSSDGDGYHYSRIQAKMTTMV